MCGEFDGREGRRAEQRRLRGGEERVVALSMSMVVVVVVCV